jgi:uncharacterized RDD family membrane protein YckC
VIDTLRPVSLPEGVEITLRLAGPFARARAWLIDMGLRTAIGVSLPPLFTIFGAAGTGLALISFFALAFLYPMLFEALWNGQTPGKRVCGLAVVHGDGTPIGWTAALVRNVMRSADMLPIGYVAGLTSMLLDSQFRRLGDLAAGTIVIHRDEPAKGSVAPARGVHVPPPVALTPLEQRAVLDFAERRGAWSGERAAELAELAAPLVQDLRGDAAVARLTAIAADLVQRR